MKNELKRELTLEELEKMYAEMSEKYKSLGDQINQKKKEEKERREAELALQKQKRYDEIEKSIEELNNLLKEYIKDYGSINLEHIYDDGISTLFRNKWFW